VIVSYIAYHQDGTSRIITFEKPSGCHPDSHFAAEYAAGVANHQHPASPCIRIAKARLVGVNVAHDNAPAIDEITLWER